MPASPSLHLAVFARAPTPGAAKTRLIPRLGAAGAARLQDRLTHMTLQRACALPAANVTLWVAGPIDDPSIMRAARTFGVALRSQHGGDLGARMLDAFEATLGEPCPMLLIGTDCPAQTVADLERARIALQSSDAVLQPAEDGGYVLIGMVHPQRALFANVAWGTDRVLDATRRQAARHGIALAEMPTTWDLDRPADLDRALELGLIDEASLA
jgi:rSAM/selenodomain-associated transferase 1